MNVTGLFANLGPPVGYRVTEPAESAPYYAILAGCFFSIAVLSAGFWIIRRRTIHGIGGRLPFFVVAGCVSIGWFSAWIWQYCGYQGVIPVHGFWNFAVDLPELWLWILAALLVLVSIRILIWGLRPSQEKTGSS